MNYNKTITVVIPTYKRPEMMDKAIKSVLGQTYRDLELYIVDDNGSGTEDQKKTEEFINRYRSDKRVKYLVNEKNLGACASRNRGIFSSDNEYVAFLDDDDRWEKNFLEEVIAKFDNSKNEKLGVVYTGFNRVHYGRNTVKRCVKDDCKCDDMYNRLIRGDCPTSTSLCVVKKACFDVTGGFDEQLSSFQDYDMWLRIAKCGYEFEYINKPLITKYEGHGDQISVNPDRRYRGLCRIREKWSRIMTAEEYSVFEHTLEAFENQIKKNRIIHNVEKGIKGNGKLYADYLKTNDRLVSKLKILSLAVFGKKALKYRK